MKANPHKRTNLALMPPLDRHRQEELAEIEREAVANFIGQLDDLFAALGMLHSGDHFGWRILVLIHNKRTIRKYEDILGIKIREFFPELGSQGDRAMAYKFTKAMGNFWKVVSGDVKVERRREIASKP